MMLSIFYKLVVTFFGINLTILLLIFLSSENEIFTRMSIFPCSVLSTSHVDPCRYLHILTLSICPLCPTTIVSHNYCVISIIVCSLPVAKTATCITSPSDCLDGRFCLVFVPLPLSKYGRLFAMKAFGILVSTRLFAYSKI